MENQINILSDTLDSVYVFSHPIKDTLSGNGLPRYQNLRTYLEIIR